jgi:hypothetical protein
MFSTSLILALALLFVAPSDVRPSIDERPGVKDFEQRVQRYWDLRNKIDDATSPVPADDPTAEEIVGRENALAEGIRGLRADAREGDIFTPQISATLTAVVHRKVSGEHGAAALETILGEGNPAHSESASPVDLRVNANYPDDASMSTVPPSVLAALPRLPEGLEYRFVGRDMILYDSEANLIVDIMRDAIG